MLSFRLFKLSHDDPRKLLLNPVEMERVLAKERARCDRYYQFFSLITLRFNKSPELTIESQEKLTAAYLESRLRLTDDKGYLRKGGIGVLLPMTDLHGAGFVLRDIRQFAESNGLFIESDVFPYNGHDGLDPIGGRSDTSAQSPDKNNDFDGEDDDLSTSEDRERKSTSPIAAANVSVESKKRRIDNPVRADASSQCSVSQEKYQQLNQLCAKPFPVWKRSADLGFALLGVGMALPVVALAAIAIKLTSKGPVFFRQYRAGQHGKPFCIYKLRTMVVDAEELKHLLRERNERDGPAFKIKHDPRVTRIGGFLRKTGLDELPQLVNVLKGDMSIVGPRPLPVGEENQCASWQQRRLDTKPGLTCTWQISKSRKISFRDWMRLDLRYSAQRSPFHDASLMIRTIAAVILGRVGH
jgi:lipopolysaccharide/colanic/teichoic acid biosynthesis glycosyltransferase